MKTAKNMQILFLNSLFIPIPDIVSYFDRSTHDKRLPTMFLPEDLASTDVGAAEIIRVLLKREY